MRIAFLFLNIYIIMLTLLSENPTAERSKLDRRWDGWERELAGPDAVRAVQWGGAEFEDVGGGVACAVDGCCRSLGWLGWGVWGCVIRFWVCMCVRLPFFL